jgi:hypothetical protein
MVGSTSPDMIEKATSDGSNAGTAPFLFDEVRRDRAGVSQRVRTAGQVRRSLELEQFGVVPG